MRNRSGADMPYISIRQTTVAVNDPPPQAHYRWQRAPGSIEALSGAGLRQSCQALLTAGYPELVLFTLSSL